MNLSHHLKRLMSDWYITKNKDRNDVDDDVNEGMDTSIFNDLGFY